MDEKHNHGGKSAGAERVDGQTTQPLRAQSAGKLDALLSLPVSVIILGLIGIVLTPTLFDWLIMEPADLRALLQTLTIDAQAKLRPEPVERALFMILTLAAPFCAAAALWVVAAIRTRFSVPARRMPMNPRILAGMALLTGIGGLGMLHSETLLLFSWFPADWRADLACLGLALGLIAACCKLTRSPDSTRLPTLDRARDGGEAVSPPGSARVSRAGCGVSPQRTSGVARGTISCRKVCAKFAEAGRLSQQPGRLRYPEEERLRRSRGISVFQLTLAFLIVLVVFLPRGLSVHSVFAAEEHGFNEGAWRVHFQAAAYGLTQLFAGKPLLTAVPPLYGYYAEMLLPVFRLLGLSVFKFCLVMATLQSLATIAVAGVLMRFTRRPAVALLGLATLLYAIGGTWGAGKFGCDPYFQYWPIRFLFPALSIPLFLWSTRRPTFRSTLCLGAFAGLALSWNLESGIAVAGATLFTLASMQLPRLRRIGISSSGNAPSRKFTPHPSAAFFFILSAACTFLLFWVFLQVNAGWKTPLHTTGEYQQLYYQLGVMMMPMPLTPHPWWLVVAVYLFALTFGLRAMWNGGARAPFTRLALFLSILGLGLFTYYQGRSHDFNLANAAWPAILLVFLFTDRLFRAMSARIVPRQLRWIALPAIYLGLVATLSLPFAFASQWKFGIPQWRMALAASPNSSTDPITRNINFIRAHIDQDRDCVILAKFQAVYYAETGLRSTLDGPGITEFFFQSDIAALQKALAEKPVCHLFVDSFALTTFKLQDTVKAHYNGIAISPSPDAALMYLEPKETQRRAGVIDERLRHN